MAGSIRKQVDALSDREVAREIIAMATRSKGKKRLLLFEAATIILNSRPGSGCERCS